MRVMRTYGSGSCRWPVACLVGLLCLVATGIAQAATFTATLDRSTISVGESAILSLTFEGGTPNGIPSFESNAGLAFQSLGEQRQVSIVNGEMSSNISYNYQVTGTRPGDYVIPGIQVRVGNQTLNSSPLRLRVIKGNGPTGLAFLKLVPSKDKVYVGEMFPIELQLYLAVNGENLQLPQIAGDGFTFGKIPQQPTQGGTQVGNQQYKVFTFRLSAVAVKAGNLAMGPAQCSLVLNVPVNPRSRSIFDDFFGGFQRKPVNLASEVISVQVMPLPKEDQPAGFNGAVGSYSFAASASPTNVNAGDPITVRLQISGQGNLDGLPFPGGTDWPDFKLYPPTSKVEPSDPSGFTGAKTFERVVIPQSAKVKEVPAVAFSFFDPERKAYRTLQSPAIPLLVRPADTAPAQPTVLAGANQAADATPPARDIVHNKAFLGTLVTGQAPLVLQPWFLGLQSLPVLAWLSAWVWRKRREQLENNPRLRRRLLVNETVRSGLKVLSQLAETNQSEAFFAAVFRLLQEQLGERLDQPASAITESVVDERLIGHAPEELVGQLHELFQICNQARYAPQHSSRELFDLVPKVQAALGALRELPELPSKEPAQRWIK